MLAAYVIATSYTSAPSNCAPYTGNDFNVRWSALNIALSYMFCFNARRIKDNGIIITKD